MTNSPLLKIENGEVLASEAFHWFEKTNFEFIPPYFLTHWKTKKSFFFFESALIAFEKTAGQLIICGEPAKTSGCDEKKIYEAFIQFAKKNKKKVCGFYVGENWENKNFTKRSIGTSFRIDLTNYDFNSSKVKEVRRSLRKGKIKEYKIINKKDIDITKLNSLIQKWKKKKLPLNLRFFLSEPSSKSQVSCLENWYVVEKNNEYYAFCSALPYKNGRRKGLYLDHLVYDPLKEKSALSYLVSFLIFSLKSQDVTEINLGLNPFARITAHGFIENIFRALYNLPFLYRPKGLHYFKGKFAGEEESEFFFYEKSNSSLKSLIGMIRTNF